MNNLMAKEVQMTSLDIAEITGKQHAHVMRDIRNEIAALGETNGSIFGLVNYTDAKGEKRPCYTFGRKGAMQLALKYDAQTRYKVIVKLEELEQKQFPKMSKELQAIFMIDEKQQQIENRVDKLENTMTIDYGQQRNLQVLAQKRAVEEIGGKNARAYTDNSTRTKVFSAIWRDYKDYFQVASYRDTLRVQYERAVEFLNDWKLTGKLLREVEECNNQLILN